MKNQKYKKLEELIGYEFKDKRLLDIAFTHRSYINETVLKQGISYERFEFLGDAILEFLVSDFLFREYPEKSEGELTKFRASLVCEFTLCKIARQLSFGEYGYYSKGERLTGGADRDSILCDMFESVLGALFLDGGLEPAKNFVYQFLLNDIEHKQIFLDSKTKLQEYAQKRGVPLRYEQINSNGPEHNKQFAVQVYMGDQPLSKGMGHSRKSAEQQAAYESLKLLLK
ncbi:MAG: ribonuclease III [Clostridium sp.]|nr:ribonuclease III [Clostridium sp.]MCM1398735.1 ribonuclease III [Clostridium sp.]MCM1458633.1 ribonuclease III [Bacteroides sp.]